MLVRNVRWGCVYIKFLYRKPGLIHLIYFLRSAVSPIMPRFKPFCLGESEPCTKIALGQAQGGHAATRVRAEPAKANYRPPPE